MKQQNTEEAPLSKGAGAGSKVRGLRISVTQTLIDTAMPKNSGHCMISDAVKAAAVAKRWRIGKVLTDLQTVRFSDLTTKIRYICFTPRVGQLALLAFDQGVQPEPFTMRLSPVQIIEPQHRTKPRKKARVAMAPGGSGGLSRPVKIGGMALAVSVGLRREFGLRQMGVWQPPTVTA